MPVKPKPKLLEVVLDGRPAGQLSQNRDGQITFIYSDEYRGDPNATPLSLSMRLTRREHRNDVVVPFLRGLLPDSRFVLDRWASRFGVSANSPFALLAHIGEDVAGAVQFVLPDRLDEVLTTSDLELVSDDYIANRLSVLRQDRAAWVDAGPAGQFSLAGAQSKFALYRDPTTGQWGLPSGRNATTHIIKPAIPSLADQDVNEHLCLAAARHIGLLTAESKVMLFGGERAIVLERYDRQFHDGSVVRIHQEDFCQALSVMPENKYERVSAADISRVPGPGIVRMIELMRTVQSPDDALAAAEHYIKALAFNWLIYAPDAHAKNYSILLVDSEVLPSPLYDITSVLPYPRVNAERGFNLTNMAMAMSINGKFENALVLRSDWEELGRTLKIAPDQVIRWVTEVAERVPDAFTAAAEANEATVGDLAVVKRLVDGIADYSAKLHRQLLLGSGGRRRKR